MFTTITNKEFIENLPEDDRLEYQRLKGIEDLAKALGKEVPEDVKGKLKEYEKKIGGENEIINEKKYEKLKELKEELEAKMKEKNEIEIEINGFNLSGMNETILKIQKSELNKLNERLQKIEGEIENLEKEVKDREREIKEIEETYDVKSFDSLDELTKIGGKPVFKAGKNGKFGIIRGSGQLGD